MNIENNGNCNDIQTYTNNNCHGVNDKNIIIRIILITTVYISIALLLIIKIVKITVIEMIFKRKIIIIITATTLKMLLILSELK